MRPFHLRSLVIVPLLGMLMGCASGLGLPFAQAESRIHGLRHRDPLAILKAADAPLADRNPELRALKAKEMGASPFAFFRGSAALFYADARSEASLASPVSIPLQGDFHLENLGTYQTSSGPVAYGLNDFDEAFTGPYRWDLARCAVSIRLAAEEMSFLDDRETTRLMERFLDAVFQNLENLADAPQALSKPLVARDLKGPAREAVLRAEAQGRPEFLQKQAPQERFKLGKKIRAVDEATRLALFEAVTAYASDRPEPAGYFRIKDVAERIAGVASLGRYRYVVLVEGPTASPADDRILELKEALPSAGVIGMRPGDPRVPGLGEALRVRDAYRYFLPESDALLGVTRFRGHAMGVRELQPARGGVELSELKRKADVQAFLDDAALMAARALARSGQASRILAEQQEQKLSQRLATVAEAYVSQVKADYQAFRKAR